MLLILCMCVHQAYMSALTSSLQVLEQELSSLRPVQSRADHLVQLDIWCPAATEGGPEHSRHRDVLSGVVRFTCCFQGQRQSVSCLSSE